MNTPRDLVDLRPVVRGGSANLIEIDPYQVAASQQGAVFETFQACKASGGEC
jgi:hypothetical protein